MMETTVPHPASRPAAAAAGPEVALRNALGCYPTGVTVVTTLSPEGRPVGLTVNSFASLSLEPPLLLWSLHNHSPNRRAFRAASHFAINVLAAGQLGLAKAFANRAVRDRFDGVALRPPLHGEGQADAEMPLLAGTLAYFVCACRDAIEAGDHTLFIGRVERYACFDGEPLAFHRGRFAALGSKETR